MSTRTVTFALSLLLAVSLPSPAPAQSGWASQTSGTTADLNGVDFTGPTHGVVVGTGGTILRTTDGGLSWMPRPSSTTRRLNAVSFGTPEIGIAAGESFAIVRTTDGGSTWTSVHPNFPGELAGAHMLDAQRAYVAGVDASSQPLMGFSADGGLNWGFVGVPLGGDFAGAYDIRFLSPQIGCVVGLVFAGGNLSGAIARTTTGGSTWQTINTSQPLSGLDFADADVGVAVGLSGAIHRTTNGGASWSPQAGGGNAFLNGVSMPADLVGTAVGDGGTILRTADGGMWAGQQSGSSADLKAVVFVGASLGWAVGSGGTILHTTTGGEPPTAVSDPGTAAPRATFLAGRPNPFRGVHSIAYGLPAGGAVRLAIYDPGGHLVRRLAEGTQAAGRHEVAWDGTGEAGRRLPSGLYCYRLETTSGGVSESRTGRVVLAR